jgi:hypothetical protein
MRTIQTSELFLFVDGRLGDNLLIEILVKRLVM